MTSYRKWAWSDLLPVDGKTCRNTSSSLSESYRSPDTRRVGQNDDHKFRIPSNNAHWTLTWSESPWDVIGTSGRLFRTQRTYPHRNPSVNTGVMGENVESDVTISIRRQLNELRKKNFFGPPWHFFFGPPCTVIIRMSNLKSESRYDVN